MLAEYGGFNTAMKKGTELESLPEAKMTEGASIDDLLDGAGRRCCRSRGDRMKERENREFWIRQTVLLAMLSIDIFIFFYIAIAGFLRVRQNLDPA